MDTKLDDDIGKQMSFYVDEKRKRAGTIFSKEGKSKKIGIEDFKILKVIGRGAFGKVMLV